jgi:hypothetical protein
VCRTEYKTDKELPDSDFEKIKKKEDAPLEIKRKAAIAQSLLLTLYLLF